MWLVLSLVACGKRADGETAAPSPTTAVPTSSTTGPEDALGCASEASLDLVCSSDGEVQVAAYGPFGCFAAQVHGMQLQIRFSLEEVVDGGVLMRAWRLVDASGGPGLALGGEAPDPFYFQGGAPLVDPAWPGWLETDPMFGGTPFSVLAAPLMPLDLDALVFIEDVQAEAVVRGSFAATDGSWVYADGTTDGPPVDVRGCMQVPSVLWPIELDP